MSALGFATGGNAAPAQPPQATRSPVDFTRPGAIQERLAEIEHDLALRQADLEAVALEHFRCKRDKEKAHAEAFLAAEGTVAQRTAIAARDTTHIGCEWEGRWEGLKAVMRILDTRAAIGMSLLKAQASGGA